MAAFLAGRRKRSPTSLWLPLKMPAASGRGCRRQEPAEPGRAGSKVTTTDLDLQTYEEDEDDFVPTEEIPADEPIPFPSNI